MERPRLAGSPKRKIYKRDNTALKSVCQGERCGKMHFMWISTRKGSRRDAGAPYSLLQAPSLMQEEQPELRLYMGNLAFLLDARRPVIRIGRDQSSDLQIGDSRASRKHAEIELRGDKFVLIDRSSNGTFVAIEGEKEFILSREEAVLRGKGHIALGSTCTANPYAISFVCM